MGQRTIPDGAGVTNHFSASFGDKVREAGFTSISGLKDELEVIDGPDSRGYATGKPSRQTLNCVIPAHDPAALDMNKWKIECENGKPGHNVTGIVTEMDAADRPIAIWELENCICHSVESNDKSLDGAEVALHTYMVSYARGKIIGP